MRPLLMMDVTNKKVLPLITEIKNATQKVFSITPCQFQIDLCLAQLQAHGNHNNIIAMVATGSGKTLCFLMLLLFNNGKVIIIVMALNLLGEQFVSVITAAGFEALAATRENNEKSIFEQAFKKLLLLTRLSQDLGYLKTHVSHHDI